MWATEKKRGARGSSAAPGGPGAHRRKNRGGMREQEGRARPPAQLCPRITCVTGMLMILTKKEMSPIAMKPTPVATVIP